MTDDTPSTGPSPEYMAYLDYGRHYVEPESDYYEGRVASPALVALCEDISHEPGTHVPDTWWQTLATDKGKPNPGLMLILGIILRSCEHEGVSEVFTPYQRLEGLTGYSLRTLRSDFAKLEELGVIRRTPHWQKANVRGIGVINVRKLMYVQVDLGRLWQLTSREERTVAQWPADHHDFRAGEKAFGPFDTDVELEPESVWKPRERYGEENA